MIIRGEIVPTYPKKEDFRDKFVRPQKTIRVVALPSLFFHWNAFKYRLNSYHLPLDLPLERGLNEKKKKKLSAKIIPFFSIEMLLNTFRTPHMKSK